MRTMETFEFRIPHYEGIVRNHTYWITGIFLFLLALIFIKAPIYLIIILELEWIVILLNSYKVDGFNRAVEIFERNLEE